MVDNDAAALDQLAKAYVVDSDAAALDYFTKEDVKSDVVAFSEQPRNNFSRSAYTSRVSRPLLSGDASFLCSYLCVLLACT